MCGIEWDELRGQGQPVVDLKLAATLGLADMDPVGGSTAGPAKTSCVTEVLLEYVVPAVAVMPVLWQTPDH